MVQTLVAEISNSLGHSDRGQRRVLLTSVRPARARSAWANVYRSLIYTNNSHALFVSHPAALYANRGAKNVMQLSGMGDYRDQFVVVTLDFEVQGSLVIQWFRLLARTQVQGSGIMSDILKRKLGLSWGKLTGKVAVPVCEKMRAR